MNIVVTGASGFVGKALVARLLAGGHRVSVVVRRRGGWPGVTELEYDFGGTDRLQLPRGIDAVVHAAQSRSYRRFPEDAAEMFGVNVAGTQAILDAAVNAGAKTFCYVSSGTVYEPYAVPLVEDAALAPTSYLGASKLAGEVLCRPYSARMSVSILRLFAPYGAGQQERLLPELARRIRAGIPVTLPETGSGMVFTPTHVDDICVAIRACLLESWTGVFNVACPNRMTVENAARTIARAMGVAVEFERKPIAAPVIAPELKRLAAIYDLGRFRPFAEGVRDIIGD